MTVGQTFEWSLDVKRHIPCTCLDGVSIRIYCADRPSNCMCLETQEAPLNGQTICTASGLEPSGLVLRCASAENNLTQKIFFGYEFLMKNAPKFSPIFLSLYLVGPKKSRKIHAISPPKIPAKLLRKITDELQQERRENQNGPF